MQPKDLTFEEILQQEQDSIPDSTPEMNINANLTANIPGLSPASIYSMTPNVGQESLQGRSPLDTPEFANAQPDSVLFMNNLFKDTPGFDKRLVPEYPRQNRSPDVTAAPADLKTKLAQFKTLRKPSSETSAQAMPQPQEAPVQPQGDSFDKLLLGQGMSKVLQGIARTQGGQIDDNSDFYNKYRQYQLEKPQKELEQKMKQKEFDDKIKRQDPNSQESKTFRKLVESTLPGIVNKMKENGIDFNAVAASDKDSILDFGRLRENVDARLEVGRLNAQARQDSREDKNFQRDLIRQDKLAQQARLSEKQVKDLTSLDQGIDLLSNIEGQKSNFDTGPLSSGLNSVAQMVGMDDAQKSAFKADIQSNVAEYIKSISGAAVSDTERKYLLQNMPNMSDNDKTFDAKLKLVKDRLERNRQTYLDNIKKAGKNTEEFGKKAPSAENDAKVNNNNLDSTIENYAKEHNINYKQAEKILLKRGYK